MKPDKTFHGRSTIRMYNCDCMEFMKGKPENHWDLAIVDPPYGIGADKKQRSNSDNGYKFPEGGKWKTYHKTDWDKNVPTNEYFIKLKNKSSNQIIWGANYYNTKPSKCWIIWDKVGRDRRNDGEMAWTSFNKSMRIFRYNRADAYINECDSKIHPCQKPVKLYRWLLQNYATEGDTILDTHGGSMSLTIACWEEGFDLDICELDSDYFNAAVKRFENHIAQQKLF